VLRAEYPVAVVSNTLASSSQEKSSVDCLFCRIVAGAIPATVVAETDLTLAFRDVNPTAPTHVLVIPKSHIANAGVVDATHGATIAQMFTTAQQVAETDGLADRGYRLVFNVGEDSGNTVAHLHMHVIGGQPLGWPPFR
jgi:histidine triad (HIT) family protein